MVVVKGYDYLEGPIFKLDGPLCGLLYKDDDGSIVTWSVTDPYDKMNCFTWSRKDNYWVVPGYNYNKTFKNLQGPIHNGQFRS